MSIEESDASPIASRPMTNDSVDNAIDKPSRSAFSPSSSAEQNLPSDGEVIQPQSFSPLQGKVKKQSSPIKPFHVAIGLTLILLASTAIYLFSAKSVYFVTDPEQASVSVSNGIAIQIGEGFLMHSGGFTVTATAPGYHPLRQEFVVGDAQNQSIPLALTKLPGQLTVVADINENGQVLLDGTVMGGLNTKLEDIEPGNYLLTINTERYLPYQEAITIEGKEVHQTHAIELNPAWANVDITTDPVGASISIDGELVGQTPMTAEILQGEREIVVKLAGHKGWNNNLVVQAGQAFALDPINLEKADGLVAVRSTPNAASITVNGNYYGQTPLEIALIPGQKHQVTLFKDGYQVANKTIDVVSGQEQQISVNLLPSLGEIKISAEPNDALLYVDGRLMGRANQQLRLPAKQTQITIKKDGYADYQTTILPRPKFDQSIPIRLKTLEQVKWENIKPMIVSSAGQQLKLFRPEDKFTMGSSRREQGRRANESLRDVSLSRPFYLGVHEVTNAQFKNFSRQHLSGNVKGQTLDIDNYPVVNVSWQQAALYCNWLSEQEGLPHFYTLEDDEVIGFNPQSNGYRMATEAEWAWAARYHNNTMLKYAWGNNLIPPPKTTNIADRNAAPVAGYIQPSYDDGYAVTAPVGSFSPNNKGIYDLDGNVAEWLNDFYEVSTGLSQKTEEDPIGPSEGAYHLIRGPSWAHGGTTELRLSFRDYGTEARNDLGFRIARFVD